MVIKKILFVENHQLTQAQRPGLDLLLDFGWIRVIKCVAIAPFQGFALAKTNLISLIRTWDSGEWMSVAFLAHSWKSERFSTFRSASLNAEIICFQFTSSFRKPLLYIILTPSSNKPAKRSFFIQKHIFSLPTISPSPWPVVSGVFRAWVLRYKWPTSPARLWNPLWFSSEAISRS